MTHKKTNNSVIYWNCQETSEQISTKFTNIYTSNMIANDISTYYGKDIIEKSRIEILEKINNKIVKFLLDTGASMAVLNRKAIQFRKSEHKNDFHVKYPIILN